MTDPNWRARTSTVPEPLGSTRHWTPLLLVALSHAVVVSAGEQADIGHAQAVQRTQAAESWLRLENDQRRERDSAGGLSGQASRETRLLEQQERLELRTKIERQRQALDATDHLDRLPSPSSDTGSAAVRRDGLLQEQRRQLDALRLQQQTRRRINAVGGH